MSVVDVLCLVVALGALGGWSFFLVAHSRALLPQAQALQALSRLKAMEDEKLARVLGHLGQREEPKLKEQVEEIRRKAEAFGFDVTKPKSAPTRSDGPLIPPPPEPIAWGTDFLE